jgi:hypothetical protein
MKAPQKSLKKWTKQKWRTKSGKPSTQGSKATGERYLPSSAIKSLSNLRKSQKKLNPLEPIRVDLHGKPL